MLTTGQHRQIFIVVLGRQWRDGRFYREPAQCLKEQINNTVIISTPDASNLKGEHMLDLMALTYPGPHLFLVVLEGGKQPERELRKWKEVFGEDISHNMIYITDYKCRGIFSGKCISIKEDIINHCEQTITKDNHTTYSFGEFLNRRKQRKSKMAAEMETEQSSHPRVSPSPVSGDQQKSQQLNLVLLGESGSGKSASGNTIMGEKAFTSEPSSKPVTTVCETQIRSICGTEVTVIDTPDLSDDSLQEQSRHIQRCRELSGQKGGLCVYLLVIQIGRFTEGERGILERLEKALETTVRDRAIILFTRGDDLRRTHIDEYVRKTDPHLQQLIEKCGKRYQVFSNTTSHQKKAKKQMKELMKKISELVQATDGVKVFPECDAKKRKCCSSCM